MKKRIGIFSFIIIAGASADGAPPASGPEAVALINYETGTLDSGISGVKAHLPKAIDAITVASNITRTGKFAVRSKLSLDDSYISHGAHRAESNSMRLLKTRYNEGDQLRYQFSIYLPLNWQVDTRESIDIIWQFKRFEGQPDMFVAIKGKDLVLRSNGAGKGRQDLLLKNVPTGEWIDLRLDVTWSITDKGSLAASLKKKGR